MFYLSTLTSEKKNIETSRGERSFVNFPRPAAFIYNKMMNAKSTIQQIEEIAEFLNSITDCDNLLDVGTGPGKLLQTIHKLNPQLNLFGFDISESMIRLAKKNLNKIQVELKVGRIQETDYPNEYFDIVTSTGSFYLWNEPEKGLNEIYRILKKTKTAYIFETYSDYDEQDFKARLKQNLKEESFIRRKMMPRFLLKQLHMTYTLAEIRGIIANSKFKDSYKIQQVMIANLPVWVRIELTKS